ncbi:MAG: hypothetical protein CVV14_06340 [Gammaproteobacteria bacterium HGW-Gammaproteobacteria-4]|jgi:hypothetical protein|nr:MAG: hypothetical protein CVV14_06340 [Gammaproteobacteria bacterium HGW-Gammaproteobacteria-4]
MVRVYEFLLAIAIVVLVFVLFGITLPDHRSFEDSIETNRSPRIVFDTMNGFKRFPDWNALYLHDPKLHTVVTGPDFGVDARLEYRSRFEDVGSGAWELIGSDDAGKVRKLRFLVENDAFGKNKSMSFEIERKGKTTEVRQRYRVDYGWNLLGRYAGMYLARTVGDDMDKGLKSLAALFATIPNMDYSGITIESVQIPAQDILFIPTSSERNINAVENAMINQLKWLRQVMAKNDLEPAGPYRLITTNFGGDAYDFDIAYPVRKKGTGPAPKVAEPVADGDDGAEPAEDEVEIPGAEDMAVVAVPLDPATITLEGEVRFGRSYQGRALKTTYTGHPAGLPVARDQLRAYALTRGEVLQDRAFEEYLNDIEDTSVEDTTFNVYWPVK